MDAVKAKRERRLRRAILRLVESSKARGGCYGHHIADGIENLPDVVAELDDTTQTLNELTANLTLDLVNLGLLTARDVRTLKSERPGLDRVIYQVTAQGTALLAGAVPVCPLVEDERI